MSMHHSASALSNNPRNYDIERRTSSGRMNDDYDYLSRHSLLTEAMVKTRQDNNMPNCDDDDDDKNDDNNDDDDRCLVSYFESHMSVVSKSYNHVNLKSYAEVSLGRSYRFTL